MAAEIPKNSLFGLPRELRDEILRLAFVQNEEGVSKIIALEKWLEDERERRRRHAHRRTSTIIPNPPPFVPRPMPTCPLYGMIVNNQFFDEAATAYLRYQTLKCDDMWTFNKFCSASRPLKAHTTKFVCRWDRRAEKVGMDSWSFFNGLKRCESLRELHITVHDRVFDILQNRLVCSQALAKADIKKMQEVYDLVSMPSLQHVKMTAEPSALAATEAEQKQWRKNVAFMEALINVGLREAKARQEGLAEEQSAPVYTPIPGFTDMTICISKYSGQARKRVANLIRACGAEVALTMKPTNTHLVTSCAAGEKWETAQDWKVCVVNHLWLEDSFIRHGVQSTQNPKYTNFPLVTEPRTLSELSPACERIAFDPKPLGSIQDIKRRLRRFLGRPGSSSSNGTSNKKDGKLRQSTPESLLKPAGIIKNKTKPQQKVSNLQQRLLFNPEVQTTTRTDTSISRRQAALTAGIAFCVSSVNTVVLWKLLSG